MSREKYRVVDLFCGAGGFSRGFHDSGVFVTVLGIDSQPSVAKTFKYNFPESIVIAEDIKSINSSIIKRIAGKPDVIIGSPPCEPYTGSNPRRMRDPLDRLYVDPIGRLTLEFIRIVGDIEPKVWVMENVPAIMEDGLKDALEKEFARAGYTEIYFNVLKAENYCTPSKRTRVFISNIKLDPPRCDKKITVLEAFRGLPPPGDYLPNHEPLSMSQRKEKRIRRSKWGEALIYYEGYGGRRLPNLIRLDPKKIAPTVLGSSRFVHPFEDRFLTVREQARLMGYPDTHVFLGGRDEQYNMVGESVPPPLAKAIALKVHEHLLLME
jgi:DNA (cytosine-5)-methyltransferase 1